MVDWTTVWLVLGSNGIMGLVYWFSTRKQIKSSENGLEKRLEAQREEYKHRQRWDSRSKTLMELRSEMARMAAKGERVAELVQLMMREDKMKMGSKYGGWIKTGQVTAELNIAMDDWNNYMASRVFQEVLFMQDNPELVDRVDEVRREYERARYFMNITDVGSWVKWLSEEARERDIEDINQGIHKTIELIIGNRERVAEVQSRINELLEEL